mmetsp:Transcript_12999/g.25495  ORF Transcript_12999/g.25495 Transcript_12999/m.25495 type:complete len:212 (+) Transcript_12999:167-802(+)
MNPIKKEAVLSRVYRLYVLYECILVNLLGFFTLFFQCELQGLEQRFLHAFPSTPKWIADSLFGHFWLQGDLNCDTRASRCLTYMIAGWLLIAGTLQVFINFDGLRQRIFRSDWQAPRGLKILCMYIFFVCDWYWVVLMVLFRDVIGWQQIVGSAIDILLRLPFAFKPARMFESSCASAVLLVESSEREAYSYLEGDDEEEENLELQGVSMV